MSNASAMADRWRLEERPRRCDMWESLCSCPVAKKRRPTLCNERLNDKSDGSMLLAYTGLRGELEHLKIETRLIDETFAIEIRDYVSPLPGPRSRFTV